MSTTLLPDIQALVMLRHDLRAERLTEKMLAPRIAPKPLAIDEVYCAKCGEPRRPRSWCQTCRPVKSRQTESKHGNRRQSEIRPANSPGRLEAGVKIGAKALGISVEEYREHRQRGERWCSADQRWESEDRFYRYARGSRARDNGQRFSASCRQSSNGEAV